jgi:prepilin-type N-terminal cleavage/methylation domain-containing protein
LTAASLAVDAATMTLTELLVALALVGVLSMAALGLLEQGQRAWATGAARAESQQSARVALGRLVADVRAAGFGREGFDAVAVAEPDRIVLQQDLDGDGAIAAAGERVTWRLAGSILRRDAGGGAQPVVNGVRGLELRYLDARGMATSAPAEVRSVVVALATAPDGGSASPTTSVSTRVRLRNR